MYNGLLEYLECHFGEVVTPSCSDEIYAVMTFVLK